MLSETNTNDFVIYDVVLRNPKDAYTARKVQKDIRKLEKWLHALMDQKDVILFYNDNGEEKMIVGSRMLPHPGIELPVSPLEDEEVNGIIRKVSNHCCFLSVPSRQPTMIHFNDINKFVVSHANVNEISKSIEWH